MDYILNSKEIKELLSVECVKSKSFDEDTYNDLIIHFEGCRYWTSSIHNLNHLLSVVLEQFEKENRNTLDLVRFVYALREERQYIVQEGTEEFLDSLFNMVSNPLIELEEELISAQKRINDYEW